MKHLFSLVLFLLPLVSTAQVTFSGRVLDNASKSGVPFATVFLTGTTLGVSTDEEGYFSLQVPEGSYEVLTKMVGYQPNIIRISTGDMQQEGYQIFLTPAFVELESLKIEDQRDPIWYKNLAIFKQFFLGTSKNAKSSKILNQIMLRMDSDSEPHTLKVSAHDLLQIVNTNLGYRVEYLLEKFTYSQSSKSFHFSGYPQFVPDTTLSRSRAQRIEANRRKAFLGSFQHLIRSLYEGTADEEGFEFRTVVRTENPERPPQREIDAAKELFAMSTNASEKDSLNRHFLRKERLKPYIDRLIDELIPGTDLVCLDEKGNKYLTFENLLHVTYTRELESIEYLNQFSPRRPERQQSILSLNSGDVQIFKNGAYGQRSGVFLDGYMGWERIGELMPLDYKINK